MNRLTNDASCPIERAHRAAAIDDAQATLLADALGECPCVNCAAAAIVDASEPLRIALLRFHAWSTSRGPMQ